MTLPQLMPQPMIGCHWTASAVLGSRISRSATDVRAEFPALLYGHQRYSDNLPPRHSLGWFRSPSFRRWEGTKDHGHAAIRRMIVECHNAAPRQALEPSRNLRPTSASAASREWLYCALHESSDPGHRIPPSGSRASNQRSGSRVSRLAGR